MALSKAAMHRVRAIRVQGQGKSMTTASHPCLSALQQNINRVLRLSLRDDSWVPVNLGGDRWIVVFLGQVTGESQVSLEMKLDQA